MTYTYVRVFRFSVMFQLDIHLYRIIKSVYYLIEMNRCPIELKLFVQISL